MRSAKGYGTAVICEEGHVASIHVEQNPHQNKPFCPECGAKTITKCPSCSTPIPGYELDSMSLAPYKRPGFCVECGKSYPWTEKLLQSAADTADLVEGLNDAEKAMLKRSLEEIIRGTPSADTAAQKVKILAVKAGKWSADLLKNLLVEIGSEAALKAAGVR
jgi:hypothetical protein